MNMLKEKKANWTMLYIVSGILDLLQLLVWWTGVGLVVSSIVGVLYGILLIAYFEYNDISMISRPTRLVSLLGITSLDGLTGGIAPAWVIDIWQVQASVRKENQRIREYNLTLIQDNVRAPLYQNGTRPPRINTPRNKPLNVDGVRPPKLKT